MKRRVEEVSARPEAQNTGGTIPYVSTGPHNQVVSLSGNAAGGYVRVPPSNISLSQQVPRLAQTVVGVTGTNQATHDHPSHPVFPQNYVPTKAEMHGGIHPIPYSTSSIAPTTPAHVNIGSIEGTGSRTVVAASGTVSSGTTASSVNPASNLRRIGPVNTAVVHPVTNNTVGNAAVLVASSNQGTSGQFQRLKVEDALSYLDQVKLRFGQQPQVYNDFLDIMKEFKSQSIDTPGVIARVSQLFRGHPELIVGFNTFLPPGYKIEVSLTGPGQHTTVVHTPQGVHHHVNPPTTHPNPHPPTSQPSAVRSQPVPQIVSPSCRPSSQMAAFNLSSLSQTPPQNNLAVSISSPVFNTTACAPSSVTLPASISLTGQPIVCTANAVHSSASLSSLVPSTPLHTSTPTVHNSAPSAQHSSIPQPGSQPVEFNHAINYVNKIKNRFQEQPFIYKQFLDILHTYQKEQKEQKSVQDGGPLPPRPTLTEAEVFEKVAKLFAEQEDLLQEFSQFLPDATNGQATQAVVSDYLDQCRSNTFQLNEPKKSSLKTANISCGSLNQMCGDVMSTSPTHPANSVLVNSVKRPHPGSAQSQPPVKKPKLNFLKDMSAAEAGKFAALADYGYFDKVRKAVRHTQTYQNFLRCIQVFNDQVVSKNELLQMIHPFLSRFPDLIKQMKDLLFADSDDPGHEPIPAPVAKQERISGDLALEVDYTTCKRLGASYCALPKSQFLPSCSGRTVLCKEVLNDTWVSFPSWSEDSTFVTSKKTQYEEYIYRCEDERFELDVVLETNLSTMRVLETIQRSMQRMSADELSRFHLDDTLGGNSPTIHRKSISRIYGEKANDIIDGLKKNPSVAVPLVLRRLKAKCDEWREAQKGFNKVWREQNERYYLKSLDHQGINFKQNDVKTLRSKNLIHEIETLYDERHEQAEEGCEVDSGPHLLFMHNDRSVFDDAANLIIHHVRRQASIHKEDKAKIKALVRQFIPDLFFHARMEQSDDEKDDDEEDEDVNDSDSSNGKTKDIKFPLTPVAACTDFSSNGTSSHNVTGSSKRKTRGFKAIDCDSRSPKTSPRQDVIIKTEKTENTVVNGDLGNQADKSPLREIKQEIIHSEPTSPAPRLNVSTSLAGEEYRLFLCNNNWYLLLRLHHILCVRLSTMFKHATKILAEEIKERKDRKEAAAIALRLRPKMDVPAEKFYSNMLELVKSLLDGNTEANIYEDTLREMFGINAYHAFTLDKVVNNAVRQLQHIVCDDLPAQCTNSFLCEARRGGAGGPCVSAYRRQHMEMSYQRRIEKLHSEDNCFKIRTFKREGQMAIELLDTEGDETEENGHSMSHHETPLNFMAQPPMMTPVVAAAEGWTQYIERYTMSTSQITPAMQEHLAKKPVFLLRNLRSWKRFTTNKEKKHESYQDQNMQVDENMHCKINPTTYKMVFVVNSDSFMYKKRALEKATKSHKVVTQRMKRGLSQWLNKWSVENVSATQQHSTTQWFHGKSPDLMANSTNQIQLDPPNHSPYCLYSKYQSKILTNPT